MANPVTKNNPKGAGRPPGALNKAKPKLDDALKKADSHSPEAIKIVLEIMRNQKGSEATRLKAALSMVGLAERYHEKVLEAIAEGKKEDTKGAMTPAVEEGVMKPLISLEAPTSVN